MTGNPMTGDEMEGIRQAVGAYHHWVPFAALFSRQVVPPNRPMATRLLEQALVAIIAGGASTFATYNALLQKQEVINATQSEQIGALKEQMRDSEARLTEQITELRVRQLK